MGCAQTAAVEGVLRVSWYPGGGVVRASCLQKPEPWLHTQGERGRKKDHRERVTTVNFHKVRSHCFGTFALRRSLSDGFFVRGAVVGALNAGVCRGVTISNFRKRGDRSRCVFDVPGHLSDVFFARGVPREPSWVPPCRPRARGHDF